MLGRAIPTEVSTGTSDTTARSASRPLRPDQARAVATVRCAIGQAEGASWFCVPASLDLVGDGSSDRLVLAVAVDRPCVLASQPGGSVVRLWSLNDGERLELPADGSGTQPSGWGRRAAEVVKRLAALGRPAVGIDAVVYSAVPSCPGFSFDTCFEAACALALCTAADWDPGRRRIARLCFEAQQAAGGRSHVAEQMASLAGVEDAAVQIDSVSLSTRTVDLPPETSFVTVGCDPRLGPQVIEALMAAGATEAHLAGFGRGDAVVGACDSEWAPAVATATVRRVREHAGVMLRATVLRPSAGAAELAV